MHFSTHSREHWHFAGTVGDLLPAILSDDGVRSAFELQDHLKSRCLLTNDILSTVHNTSLGYQER
jgi:hypothetical protein